MATILPRYMVKNLFWLQIENDVPIRDHSKQPKSNPKPEKSARFPEKPFPGINGAGHRSGGESGTHPPSSGETRVPLSAA